MINYLKARLYNRMTNAHEGDGVIVKLPRGNAGSANFYFVYRDNDFRNFSTTAEPASANIGFSYASYQLMFTSEQHPLRRVHIAAGRVLDSFETLIISERLRTDSVFSRYRVILGDEVFDDNGGVFAVNFEDFFVVEAHEETNVQGILIKNAYTQTYMYSGFGAYHHHTYRNQFNTPIGNDKPYRIGVELEVYARNRQAYEKITTSRTNWFQCEMDGSLDEHNYPIEIKTIPLRPSDATSVDFWNEPLTKLGQLAMSKECHSTGLHVHISKEILGSSETERQRNLSKLCTFYTYYVEDDAQAHAKNVTICGREAGYAGTLEGAKSDLSEFSKMIGFNVIARQSDTAFNRVADDIKSHIASQRWDINIRHWNDYGTIEFRKGDGSISKTRMSALCSWWEQMCLYCKETHPRDFSFDDFFNRACHESPSIAYFFQRDVEL